MRKRMVAKLMCITLLLFVVYVIAISAFFHGMSRQANLVHHQNVVRNDATNIASHYAGISQFGGVPSAEYLLTLEDVTHGRIMIADGGSGVYRLDENEKVSYCELCGMATPAADGIRRALGGETVSLKVDEDDGKTYLYACVPVPGSGFALVLKTDAAAIGDALVSDTEIILVSGLLSLIIMVVLAYAAMKAVTKPLLRLRDVADRLSEGDYSARSGIKSDDEIGSLARTMDEMAEGMRLAQQERREMEKQKNAFLSEISHELRTPVTVICASVEALQNGVADTPAKQKAYLSQMAREGGWLKKLVTELLELTRLKNAAFTFEKGEVSLEELLGDVAMSARTLSRDKGAVLRCEKPAKDIALFGDYGRLRQMFLNVLQNAVKFSPQGGLIEMAVDDGAPVVRVRDRGPGFNPDELPRLFERFSRADDSNGDSTGLGLAIANQIALRHGIVISVKSAPSEGAEFIFDLTGALGGV